MSEYMNQSHIPELEQTARFINRIELTKFALSEAKDLIYDGWGDSSQGVWELAQRSTTINEAMSSTIFEEEILRGIRRAMPRKRGSDMLPVIQSVLEVDNELPALVTDRARVLSNVASQIGLKRLGIFEEEDDKMIIPPAAYAAFAYHRADIRINFDRKLYENAAIIDEYVKKLTIEPRIVDARYKSGDSIGMSNYKYLTLVTQQSLEGLGSGKAHRGWWLELRKDFDRIDELVQ